MKNCLKCKHFVKEIDFLTDEETYFCYNSQPKEIKIKLCKNFLWKEELAAA